jgi:hypothetical protein
VRELGVAAIIGTLASRHPGCLTSVQSAAHLYRNVPLIMCTFTVVESASSRRACYGGCSDPFRVSSQRERTSIDAPERHSRHSGSLARLPCCAVHCHVYGPTFTCAAIAGQSCVSMAVKTTRRSVDSCQRQGSGET